MAPLDPSASRRVEAYAKEYGEGPEHLPWSAPREAARTLSAAQRKALARFGARIERAWLTGDPARALATAFAEVDPSSRIAVYPGAPPGGPRWVFQSVGGELTSRPILHQEQLPALRLYSLKGSDPFADVPVTNVPIMRANVNAQADPTAHLETLLIPNRAIQQLRMVTYDEQEISLYAGFYRDSTEARFDLADHALLFSLRPALTRWHRVAKALGPSPLGDSALAAALEAFDRPALLVRNRAVLFANRLGVEWYAATRAWLQAGRPSGFAEATPLCPGGFSVELILPHVVALSTPPADAPAPHLSQRYGLTPTEVRLALRLSTGASLRDVATELGMSYETARTHLKRIYEKLGVRRQNELVAKILRG